VVDGRAALQRERGARRATRGAMSERLYAEVSSRPASSSLPLLLKFNIPASPPDKATFGPNGPTQAERARIDAEQKRIEALASKKLARLLAKTGLTEEAAKARVDGPFVALTLPSDALPALAFEEDLGFADLNSNEGRPLAYPTVPQALAQTLTDDAQAAGFKGSGATIAVMEPGLLTLSSSCFHVQAQESTTGYASDHMTKVIGLIGNRYGTGDCAASAWTGYAPDANILVANEPSYFFGDAYTWIRNQGGANIITSSWGDNPWFASHGTLSPRDKYFDYWTTQFPYPTVFFAAGNNDITPNNDYAFAKGYNIISVGNITLGDWPTNRCDDTMSVYNSWKNPSSDHADREKPDIASPGDRHSLLGGSIGGTSTATPVTAGVAADLMSANSALKVWPEAIRAILFATANFQNADGQQYSRLLDGRDGVGETNAYLGYMTAQTREPTTTARYRAHDYGSMSGSSFANGYFDRTWTIKVDGPYGTHVRAALVWDSNVTDENTDAMDLDLDLEIYDPNGHPEAMANSYDNSWELVDFAPNLSGNYTMKVRGWSVPSTSFSRYWSVAWTAYYSNNNPYCH